MKKHSISYQMMDSIIQMSQGVMVMSIIAMVVFVLGIIVLPIIMTLFLVWIIWNLFAPIHEPKTYGLE